MKLEQAYQLLHIESGDSAKQIRAKYHLAVRKYHPDASKLDADKALEMTKQLNAAFTLVMKHLHDKSVYSGSFSGHHGSGSSDSAGRSAASSFSASGSSDSSSYTSGTSDRHSYSHSARNRYTWQPFDESEFYGQSAHGHADSDKVKKSSSVPVWPAGENPAAFCDRTIYAIGDLFGSMGWFAEENAYGAPGGPVNDPDDFYENDYLTRPHAVASGKYYWDPDYESFPMFLYSIHQKCKALMQSEVIDPMLLHLLALEFIRPWECLAKIADDYPDIKVIPADKSTSGRDSGRDSDEAASGDAQGTGQPAYQIESRLRLNSTSQIPFKQFQGTSLPFSVEIVREQVHLILPSGEDLGHLSFEADPLYYILLMILRSGKGQIIVKEKGSDPTQQKITGSEHHRISGNNDLRLIILLIPPAESRGSRKDVSENHNLDIACLLNHSARPNS